MTDASPITFNTGDGIALSNQPKNSARSGQNRQMTRPSDATQSVAWKLKRLRSGKPHSAGLAFTTERPNGERRLTIWSRCLKTQLLLPEEMAPENDHEQIE
jgi:hypothetical protein